MKRKILILSMLICFGMICSCQKQDSAAEQQPAEPKAELDAREQALDERMNALDEKVSALDESVKALAEREKATTNRRTIPSGTQGQTRDAAQIQAERERRIQQPPADVRTLIPDRSKVTSGDPAKQERPARRQLEPEEIQRRSQRKFEAMQRWQTSGAAVSPAAEASSPTPPSAVEATSPTSSPTPP